MKNVKITFILKWYYSFSFQLVKIIVLFIHLSIALAQTLIINESQAKKKFVD